MDTLEAVSTVMALWPTSFKPADQWRQQLTDELDGWTGDERVAAIEALKGGYNGKRISMDTLRAVRRKAGVVRHGRALREPESPATMGYGMAAQTWLADNNLWDAFKRSQNYDQVMIRRLVANLYMSGLWQERLEAQAGDTRDFAPWERIENLVYAAERALTPSETPGMGRKVCYPLTAEGWVAPSAAREIYLPKPRTKADIEASRDGMATIFRIAEKYGGLKTGNYGAIMADPEYQGYLQAYTDRTGQSPG